MLIGFRGAGTRDFQFFFCLEAFAATPDGIGPAQERASKKYQREKLLMGAFLESIWIAAVEPNQRSRRERERETGRGGGWEEEEFYGGGYTRDCLWQNEEFV